MASTANLPTLQTRGFELVNEPVTRTRANKLETRAKSRARRTRRLTLEEEVTQAQRIEACVQQLLAVLLRSPLAARELIHLAHKPGHSTLHSRQYAQPEAQVAVAPAEEEAEAEVTAVHRDEVVEEVVAELGQLAAEAERLAAERLHEKGAPLSKKRDMTNGLERVRSKMLQQLELVRLEKRHLEPIVKKLEALDAQADELRALGAGTATDEVVGAKQVEATRQLRRIEEKVGLRALELKRMIAELRLLSQDLDHAIGEMVEMNIPLVLSLAKRGENRGVAFEDLVQEGTIGLMHAVERYEWRHGLRFSTYATWWIRQAVAQAVSDLSRTVRLPINISRQIVQLNYARSALVRSLGHEAETAEIAERMKLPTDKVEQLVPLAWREISLDAPVADGADASHVDLIADDLAVEPGEAIDGAMLKSTAEELLATLTPREEMVLRLRYGLGEGDGQTLEEIGQVMGVTRERVRQIESKALERLRHPKRAKLLREFLD